MTQMGRSLVATRAIAAGEIILREWPAAHVQFAGNARRAAACLTCGRFVGSLLDQMQRVAGLPSSELTSLPLFSAEDAQLTELVRCTHAPTCDALYCSEAHRAADWKRGHKLLCVGVGPAAAAAKADADSVATTNKRARKDAVATAASSSSSAAASAAAAPSSSDSQQHPFALFRAHAESQHELFMLAARLAALVECGEASPDDLDKYVQRPWEDIVAAGDEDEDEEEEEEEKAAAMAKAKASAAAAAAASGGKRKRDAVDAAAAAAAAATESSSSTARPGSVLSHLRSVVGRSFSLLTTALYTHHSRPVPGWFNRAWYSRLVGALRLNALAVEHPTPLAEYIDAVDQVVARLEKDSKADEADSADEAEEGPDAQAEDAEEAAEQSSSSSSSSSSDDEEDDADDDDDAPPRRSRLPSPAASARSQRHRILLALMPLISGAMMLRLQEKMARQDARRAAREVSAAASSSSASGSSGSDHARTRSPDRDSYPSSHYNWTLDCSAAQHCTLRFSSRLFPSFHGSALYSTIAQANHSCAPNASVDHGQDAEGLLVALKSIAEGEQIMLSYIDESVPKAERHEQLRDYDFLCRCPKCISEISDRGESSEED